ncbi:hypothetical protein BT63DRAFT_472138, partial [Microthyrium microscopicum]
MFIFLVLVFLILPILFIIFIFVPLAGLALNLFMFKSPRLILSVLLIPSPPPKVKVRIKARLNFFNIIVGRLIFFFIVVGNGIVVRTIIVKLKKVIKSVPVKTIPISIIEILIASCGARVTRSHDLAYRLLRNLVMRHGNLGKRVVDPSLGGIMYIELRIVLRLQVVGMWICNGISSFRFGFYTCQRRYAWNQMMGSLG